MDAAHEAPRGLRGVVAASTTIGHVRGDEGFYHYRQYSAVELASKRTFEDVWFLLIHERLPNASERRDFAAEVASLRVLPERMAELLPALAQSSLNPLATLRTALSHSAALEDMPQLLDASAETRRANALRLSALVPTIAAAIARITQGLAPVAPRSDLGHAANYLWMVTGEEPEPRRCRAIEQYLMLAVDHGFNASTFAARVVASTGADFGAAIVAAVGALSGPLHGGAPSRVLDTLDAIGTSERAESWVRAAVGRGERVMGFGHRMYRTPDPRAAMLRGVAEGFGGPRVALAVAVEATVERLLAELKPGRDLHTNVEYYAAVVMELCGLPRELFTPTFAVSRTVGWCAHVLEQCADNAIFRPTARYIGPPPPQPVPEI